MTSPTAATRLVALLGQPVSQSLSPLIQNAAFRAAELDGVYLALACSPADLPGLLRGIANAGGAGNITAPHKQAAASVLDLASPAVKRTGACNTFWQEADGRVCGDNTDVAGFSTALEGFTGSPAGRRVLMLGAGGAARAAALALLTGGAERIDVFSRSAARAENLCRQLDPSDKRLRAIREIAEDRWDFLVNATPLGLRPGDPLPMPEGLLDSVGAVFDLVYGPSETELVRRARSHGIPAQDGLEMLIQQGAAAFQLWWGRPAPIAAMRAAVASYRAPA